MLRKTAIFIVFAPLWLLADPCRNFQAGVNIATVSSPQLDEVSGMVVSRQNAGVHWVHNDSGDTPTIYAINKAGDYLAYYALNGALHRDYEDIGIWQDGGTWNLYVADFGDNNSIRSNIRVVRVPEPAVAENQPFVNGTINGITTYTLEYPDGANNAETFFVDPNTGDWYIITKSEPANPKIYRAAYPQSAAGTITLQAMGTMVQTVELTGGDISQDGTEILIKDYVNMHYYCVTPGQSIAATLQGTPRTFPLATEPKGEAVAWNPDASAYYTLSENGNQPLYEYLEASDIIGFPCTFGPLTATEQVPFSFVVPFTNTGGVVFSKISGPGSINASTGQYSFTPNETGGGNTYTVTISGSIGGQSSTLSFDVMVLEANSAPILSPTVGGVCTTNSETWVSFGDIWSYRDDGSDQGTAWRAAGFNDSGWDSGPAQLGYGNNGEVTQVNDGPNNNRYITTYFRRSITEDTSDIVSAELQVIRDDGVAVFLNGTLAMTSNMPASWDYLTTATAVAGGANETTPIVASVPVSSLANNLTIAAEIHQVSSTSSDISFDLQLTVERETCIPSGLTTCVGTNATVQFSATDSDTPAQTLTYSLLSGSQPGMSLSASGLLTWAVPATLTPGLYPVEIQVSDGNLTDAQFYVFEVLPKPPVLDPLGPYSINELATLTFSPTLAQGTGATLSMANAPAGATFDPVTGQFSWMPNEAQGPGSYTLDIIAMDPNDASLVDMQTVSITVNELNQPPDLLVPAPVISSTGATFQVQLMATDPDIPLQTVSYGIVFGAQVGMSINASTGVFTWNVPANQAPATYTVLVSASDGSIADTEVLRITITTSDFQLDPIPTVMVDEGLTATFTVAFTNNAYSNITYSANTASLPGSAIDSLTGLFTWPTTEADGPGTYSVDVFATDGSNIATQSVTIVVKEVNQPPLLADPADVTQAPGSSVSFTASGTDPDVPAQSLSYSLVSAALPGLILQPNGTFAWAIPSSYPAGPVTISIAVSDGALSHTQSFVVTVNGSPLSFNPVADPTIPELSPWSLALTVDDPSAPGLTYTAIAGPIGASLNASSGVLTWTPSETDGPGNALFIVEVSDSNGRMDTITIPVTVTEANQPPSIAPLADSLQEEGDLVTRTAIGSDADLPVQTLIYSLVAPEPGMVIFSDGSFSWTVPDGQPAGDVTVMVEVSDGISSAFESFIITIKPPAPDISPLGPFVIDELVAQALPATVTDGSLAGLIWTATGTPSGLTVNPSTGIIAWTPSELQGPGSYNFNLIVTDAFGQADTQQVFVTVNEVNVPPTLATIPGGSNFPGDSVTRTANGSDTDLPAQNLTYSISAGSQPGMSMNASTGAFNWTIPANTTPGDYPVTVRVTDGPTQSTTTFIIHVDQAAPQLAQLGAYTINELAPFSFVANPTDLSLTGLTWSATGIPSGASFANATGTFNWPPTETQGPAVYNFDVVITGPFGRSDTQTVMVTVLEINQPPILAPLANGSAFPGDVVTRTASATDADLPAQTITYGISAGMQIGMSINPSTGAFSWAIPNGATPGDYTITLEADDGNDQHTQSFVIHVDQAGPVLNPVPPLTRDELSIASFAPSVTDASLTGLVYSVTGAPSTSTFNPATGAFSWTPTEAEGPTSLSLDVVVTGPFGRSDTQTVAITINEVNLPPTLAQPANTSEFPGGTVSFTASATDPDIPVQALSYTISSGMQSGMSIHPTTGAFVWNVPAGQAPASYTVVLQVSDGSLTNTKTFTITVGESAPVIANLGPFTTDELSAMSFTAVTTDPSLMSLTWTATGAPAGSSFNSAGAFSWTPTEIDGPGSFNVDVIVTDNLGRADTQTVAITVNEVNLPPQLAAINNGSVSAGTAFTTATPAIDADIPTQGLTWSIASGMQSGMSINPTTGALSWTVPAGQTVGAYPVTIQVTDGSLTDTEAFTINVTQAAPDLAPIAATTIDEMLAHAFTAVTTDTSLTGLTWSVSGNPSGSTLNPASGAFSWTPSETQGPGSYSFTITATDNLNRSDTETVTITVDEVNRPPVLPAIADINTSAGDTRTTPAPASDPDVPNQSLTWSIVSGSQPGMSINPGSGLVTWAIPASQTPGNYTAVIQVSDGSLSATTPLTWLVGQAAPIIRPVGPFVEDEQTLINFTADTTDTSLINISWSVAGQPSGSGINPLSGIFTWVPTEAQGPATYLFELIATDASGRSDTNSVSITVNEVNLPPNAIGISDSSAFPGSTISFTAIANDSDLPAQSLTWSILSGNQPGMSINPSTGAFAWSIPGSQAAGAYPISLQVSDGSLHAVVSFTIHVDQAAPFITPIPNLTVVEHNLITFTAATTDNTLTGLTWSITGAPAGSSFNPNTGAFSWTPNEAQGPGSFPMTVTVNGPFGRSDTEAVTITVNEANVPPILAALPNVNAFPGDTVTQSASASDSDIPTQTLTYSIQSGSQPGMSLNPTTGAFSWNIPGTQPAATYTVVVQVGDGIASDSTSFDVGVGQSGPILSALGPYTTDELANFTFTATVTDSSLSGLTYSLTGAPTGSSFNPLTGAFTWTPTETDGPGSVTFDVAVTDSLNRSDTRQVTITIDEVNQAPALAAIANGSVTAGTTISRTASGSDADVPTQSLSYSISAGLQAGMTINSATGIFNWSVPASTPPGGYPVTVNVSDGVATTPRSFTITVGSPAPTIAALGPFSLAELTSLSANATVNETGLSSLTWSLSGHPTGMSINPASGLISWIPTEAQGPGSYTFTTTVTDSLSRSDSRSVTVTVTEVNQPPTLAGIPNVSVIAGTTFTATANGNDADIPTQSLSYSIATGQLSGMSINPSSGTFTWNVPGSQTPGNYPVTLRVSDGTASAQQIFTLSIGTPAPTLSAIGPFIHDELTPLTFTGSAAPTGLSWSMSGAPSGATINPTTGAFSWTPTETQGPGSFTFTVTVTDSQNRTASRTVTVTVNEVNTPPVLTTVSPLGDIPGATISHTLAASDSDVPSQALTYSIISGLRPGMSLNANSGAFTWNILASEAPGTYNVVARVSDGSATDTTTIPITIGFVPVSLQPIPAMTVNELSPVSFIASASPSSLTYSLVGAPSGASISPSSGAFIWTPGESDGPGSVTFTVVASDGNGQSDSQSVTVTINEVNQPPVLAGLASASALPGGSVSRVASATDSDLPTQAITYSIVSGLQPGMTIHPSTGILSWAIPAAQGSGTFPITVRASDGLASDTESFTISIGTPAPVLQALGPFTIDELSPLTFTASASPVGLVYRLIGAPSAAGINPTSGDFTWTPNESDGPGTFTFDVEVEDSINRTDRQTVTVNVNEVNQPPVLSGPANSTGQPGGTALSTFTAIDVDLPAQSLSYSLVGPTQPGMVIGATSGAFNWAIPASQAPGTYTITVQVSDGLSTDNMTHMILVDALSPVLNPVATTTTVELATLTIPLSSSPSGLTYSLINAPAGMIVSPAGVISWTPSETDGPSMLTFSARVEDSAGRSDTISITVVVAEDNQAPQITAPGPLTGNPGDVLSATFTASDADLPNQTLSYSIASGALPGMSVTPTTGAFVWTVPASQAPGTYPVQVEVSDGGLRTAAPLLITIGTPSIQLNSVPLLNVTEGNAVTFVASVATPSAGITYSLVGAPSGATISQNSGAFIWLPGEIDGPGITTFTLVAQNPAGDQAAQLVSIQVAEANRAPDLQSLPNQYVTRGDSFQVQLIATDPDIPAQALSYSILAGAHPGMSIDANGVFYWNVPLDQVLGGCPVLVQVSDGALTDIVGLLIQVTPGAPVIDPVGPISAPEQSPLTFTPQVTNISVPLTWSLGSNAPVGATIHPSTGLVSWTPAETDGPGTFLVDVIVSDNNTTPNTDTQTVSLTITEVNQAPVIAPISMLTIPAGSSGTASISASDADVPTQTLSYSILSGSEPGMSIGVFNGVFSWNVPQNQMVGSYPLTIGVSDGVTQESSSFTIQVDLPALQFLPITPMSISEGAAFTFTPATTEPDLNALYFINNAPPSMSINPFTGLISWLPTEADGPSTWSVELKVIDRNTPNRSDIAILSITVDEVNQPPVLAPIANITLEPGTPLALTASATDSDSPVQAITYSLAPNAPAGMSIDPNTGVFSYTPAAGGAAVDVTVFATDSGSPPEQSSQTFSLSTVNNLDLEYEDLAPPIPGELIWTAIPGRTYAIERSETIIPGDWQVIATITATASVERYDDTVLNNLERLYFYRVVLQP